MAEGARSTGEKAEVPGRLLTFTEINNLTGDDVEYWLGNPFLDREAVGEKVRWWITVAVQANVANVLSPPEGSAS